MKFTAITQTKHEGDNSVMREGYTSQAKKALAYAVKTAEKCGHNYVGTEHLLIGLLNVEDGTAGMVLSEFHVDAGQLTELIDLVFFLQFKHSGNPQSLLRCGYILPSPSASDHPSRSPAAVLTARSARRLARTDF